MTEKLRAMLGRWLDNLKYRNTNSRYGVSIRPEGYEYVEIPAWELRQALSLLNRPSAKDADGVVQQAIADFVKELGKHKGKPANSWSDYVAWANVEHVANSLAALPALSQRWSPIESAPPTDYNSRILLRCVSKSGSFSRPVIIDGYLEKSAGREYWETGFSYKLTPTHWMPLPTAPKQEG